MESEVFTNQQVISVLNEKYVPVKVNADHFPATARQYGITALPTTVITTSDGRIVDLIRGRLETAQYIDRISRAAARAEKRKPVEVASAPQTNTPPWTDKPANPIHPGNNQASDPVQPDQVAAAVPPSQPGPVSDPIRSPSAGYIPPAGGYAPPTGYSPPQDHYSPPAPPMTAAQPPYANARPNPVAPADQQPTQYNNPPAMYGQAPYQAPPSPAYGSPSPPSMPVQPPLNTNPYAANAAVQPPAYNSQPPAYNSQPPAYNNQPPVANNQPAMGGNPPLCLDGYCPVSLCRQPPQWVPGDVRWGAIHRGRTYLFAGPEEQKRFFADPDRYAPVGSGNDVVLAAEQGRAVPGMREHGVFFGSQIYLFASEESLQKFAEKPEVYANQVLNRISQRP